MCGIVGLIDARHSTSQPELEALVSAMAIPLRHRGPDGAGTWVDTSAGVAFCHRRLAVVDLSERGHQPMVSPSGRWILNYNGEVYNATELRCQLEGTGVRFRGHSDTEVLLAAIDRWGVDTAVERINGMFAFAAWDKEQRVLELARDRLGEKPLYYGWFGHRFIFASSLAAVRVACPSAPAVDRTALGLLLRYGYLPTPWSILEPFAKLESGCVRTVKPSEPGRVGEPRRYWDPLAVVSSAKASPVPAADPGALDQLDSLLRQSVSRRLVADVAVGTLLSGGIDSSLVTALAQSTSSQPLRTFTVGFSEAGYNEASAAKAVAAHLGTDHTEQYVTDREALSVVPDLPAAFDEPLGDSSQIPTLIVARLARQSVKVALSGDGGDELFGGYSRHVLGPELWARLAPFPLVARRAAGAMLHWLSPERLAASRFVRLATVGERLRGTQGRQRVLKLQRAVAASDSRDLYQRLVTQWPDASDVVLGAPITAVNRDVPPRLGFAEEAMFCDMCTYLPDDILAKVDRATMATSLEARVPFLDPAVVEFAWRLGPAAKIDGRTGKVPLRRLLDRYVPAELVDRPKMGFAVPVGDWLRTSLRDWAGALLDRRRLASEGYFDVEIVARRWDEHVSGRRDWQHQLWAVLSFQSWLERNGE